MNVLCISAHPDDETLGCGGTLLRHAAAGDSLYWLIATTAYEPVWSADVIRAKRAEVEKVAAAYGMKEVCRLDIHATQVEEYPRGELIRRMHEFINRVRPQVVYTVHRGDSHSDHRCVFEACGAALKSFRAVSLGIQKVYSFETLSSTETGALVGFEPFVPHAFVDVSKFMDRKMEIMDLYASEMQDGFMPRSPSAIRALARYRGSMLAVEHAEAFEVIMDIRG